MQYNYFVHLLVHMLAHCMIVGGLIVLEITRIGVVIRFMLKIHYTIIWTESWSRSYLTIPTTSFAFSYKYTQNIINNPQ